MEDEKEAAAAAVAEETRWRARRTREGLAVYNATIAGCDRSCELRVGNLGTVYANLREEDAGRRGWRGGRGEGGGGGGEGGRWENERWQK